jgi:hypothetical protein
VSGFDGEIEIADTTEHMQALIWGGDIVAGNVGTSHTDHLAGEAIQQICDSVEAFYLVASHKNRNLKK